jgi:hypothetical protein
MTTPPIPDDLEQRLSQLGVDQLSGISITRSISLYTRDEPQLKRINVFPPGSQCTIYNAIDVAGQSDTGNNGRLTWKLSTYVCISEVRDRHIEVSMPASFVATANSPQPLFITATIAIPDPPTDLIVEVYSWNHDGTPAPNVRFSWRCRVGYNEVIE